MKSIPNNELNTAFFYLSSITSTGLSVPELKQLRAARKNVKEKADEYTEVRKSIWESYNITEDSQLIDHPKKEEVLAKIVELDNEKVEIEGLNFLTEDQVIGCSPAVWNQNDIDKVIEYLAK